MYSQCNSDHCYNKGFCLNFLGKSNKLSSDIVHKHGFHNGVIAYVIQFGESTIHIIFVAWVIFLMAIFSCLNFKPDYA